MTGAPFRAIGGSVVADHGPIALADARALQTFYAGEADHAGETWTRRAVERSHALADAVKDAERWRRAAGWTNPDDADQA